MTLEDILKKEEMPMGKSQRDLRHEGIYSFMLRERTPSALKTTSALKRRLVLSEAREVYEGVPEGKVRSPGLGARVGLPNLHLSSLSEAKDRNTSLRHEGIHSFNVREGTPSILENVRERDPSAHTRDSSPVFRMTKSRSNLNGNVEMRQERIGLLEKKTRLKFGEVDFGCEMR